MSSSEVSYKDLSRQAIINWSPENRDLSVFREIFDENIVAHDPLAGDQHGLQSQIDFFNGMTHAFPDVRPVIKKQSQDGNVVTSVIEFTGTHAGSLFLPDGSEIPATNRRATVGVEIKDRYGENGKVVESWAKWNPQKMLEDLGVQM